MKKLLILAATLAALTALVLPSAAQATTNSSNWTHNHVDLAASKTIPVTGNASFSGGTSCTHVTASITLEPGNTGKVTAFAPTVGTCEVTGTLKALGCTKLAAGTSEGLPWTIHNQFTDMIIKDMRIVNHYEGGNFCPKTTEISGEVTTVPVNTEAITQLTLHGEVNSSLGTKVTVGGTLKPVNASDSGTYGLHAPTKASNWVDNHADITQSRTIPVTGNESFSGGTSCTHVTASITLEPGSTGKVTAYAPTVSTCTVTGTLASLGCTKLVGNTAEGLPWTVHNQFEGLIVTGTKIVKHYEGGAFCPKTTEMSGDLTVLPDNTETITHLTLHGSVNSSLWGSLRLEGTLTPVNASDSGTYGLH